MTIQMPNSQQNILSQLEAATNPQLGCVAQQIHFIHGLQKKMITEPCLDCSAPNLGEFPQPAFNTRPFILYLPTGENFEIQVEELCTIPQNNISNPSQCAIKKMFHKNQPIELPTTENNPQPPNTTMIFRVESVNGRCATLRGLICNSGELRATKFCVHVDLNCFCGIQCFQDVFIPNLCN